MHKNSTEESIWREPDGAPFACSCCLKRSFEFESSFCMLAPPRLWWSFLSPIMTFLCCDMHPSKVEALKLDVIDVSKTFVSSTSYVQWTIKLILLLICEREKLYKYYSIVWPKKYLHLKGLGIIIIFFVSLNKTTIRQFCWLNELKINK